MDRGDAYFWNYTQIKAALKTPKHRWFSPTNSFTLFFVDFYCSLLFSSKYALVFMGRRNCHLHTLKSVVTPTLHCQVHPDAAPVVYEKKQWRAMLFQDWQCFPGLWEWTKAAVGLLWERWGCPVVSLLFPMHSYNAITTALPYSRLSDSQKWK